MKDHISLQVLVISDATGRTAESVITAVLLQFPNIRPLVRRFANVRTREEIVEILHLAEEVSGIVIYSLVSSDLRGFIHREASKRGLIQFDVLGPILAKVRKLFNLIPISTPGLLEHVHEESLRVAEAIDFTVRHDDGLGMDTIHKADLLILGVSRVSKTPTSIFLACNHLLKVANYPIIRDQILPEEISRAGIPKVGLTIAPEILVEIRRQRIKYLPDYTDPKLIYGELAHAESVFRRSGVAQVIDVSYLSVEECARKIMEAVSNKVKGADPGE